MKRSHGNSGLSEICSFINLGLYLQSENHRLRFFFGRSRKVEKRRSWPFHVSLLSNCCSATYPSAQPSLPTVLEPAAGWKGLGAHPGQGMRGVDTPPTPGKVDLDPHAALVDRVRSPAQGLCCGETRSWQLSSRLPAFPEPFAGVHARFHAQPSRKAGCPRLRYGKVNCYVWWNFRERGTR